MKTASILAMIVGAFVIIGAVYMIDIDQTQEGELPRVSVEGGQAPEFDAEVGDITITEETVTVPGIDIDPPSDDS